MKGITRYGQASVPMDEAMATVCLDISGRPFLVYRVEFPKRSKLKDFDPDLIEDPWAIANAIPRPASSRTAERCSQQTVKE